MKQNDRMEIENVENFTMHKRKLLNNKMERNKTRRSLRPPVSESVAKASSGEEGNADLVRAFIVVGWA